MTMLRADLAVLGGGPGGYTAAFRAADLGQRVCLIERHSTLGGVCLNVGCIPSKALLHVAKTIEDTKEMAAAGIDEVGHPVDIEKLRSWKQGLVDCMAGSLAALAKQRKVQVLQGTASFTSANTLRVESPDAVHTISFSHCIIATGSRAATLPNTPDDPRIWQSTQALALESIPKRLLIVGGGAIGLEMATIFSALGSAVSLVELQKQLMPEADPDLLKPLERRLAKRLHGIRLNSRVSRLAVMNQHIAVDIECGGVTKTDNFDGVLVAIGRRPNTHAIAAHVAGIEVYESGFIAVNAKLQTNVAHIFAVGDVIGGPMLAHKATYEGRQAAEIICGLRSEYDQRPIPSVVYTDPEVAWVGITQTQAKSAGIVTETATFPWAANGRALTMMRGEGLTKIVFDPTTRKLLGAGIVGISAGDLIGEVVMGLEMGATTTDLCNAIHPHPTLTETVGAAGDIAEGTITDILVPRLRAVARAML